ncbi:MFS transporter [Candidatus Woesearchaeota archaeon]|nr:MFS transporter [Candidatus Woesearchaeota archaeon]
MGLKRHFPRIKKRFYLEGAFTLAHHSLIEGLFLIGFASALGADNFELGVILSIPLFANLLQMFSAFILETVGSRKYTCLISLFIGRAVWIAVILAAFGLFGQGRALIMPFITVLLVSYVFIAIGNLALLSWIKEIVPVTKLSKFFGKRNIYASAFGAVAFLIGSRVIDSFEHMRTYGYIFLTSMILGLIGLTFLIKVPDQKQKVRAIKPRLFLRRLLMPFQNPGYRTLLYFGLFWGFAINIASSFFIVFMLNDLGIDYFTVSIFVLASTIARIYGLSVWGKMGDEFGAKPMLALSATVTSCVPLAFVFINKSNYLLIPIIYVVSAISWSAIDISISQLLFKTAPKRNDAYFLANYTSLTGLFAAFGPLLAGYLATVVKDSTLPLFHYTYPLKYVFIMAFVARVLCLPLISRIQEPRAKEIDEVLDMVKSMRYFSFFSNIYFFASSASKIVLVPQKQLFWARRETVKHVRTARTKVKEKISRQRQQRKEKKAVRRAKK